MSTKLKPPRYREGLTQKQLAEFPGIPRHHISEMESGRQSIDKERARKLAEVHHCDYRQLLLISHVKSVPLFQKAMWPINIASGGFPQCQMRRWY